MFRRYVPLFVLSVALVAIIVLWVWVVAPWFTRLPADFSYRADIISLDNFYDEAKQAFSGEKRSVTKFSYEVTEQKQGNFIIKNIFDVHSVTGDKIFAVERLYGVDPKTGQHVAGLGDRDRDGYLFAPRMKGFLRQAQDKEPFTYWHINYDGPAHMTFVREENLLGLHVYRYETDFKGVRIDQTKNLTNLPGVGITRGIELEPRLQIWVEPVTGRMVKYEDDTVAYYYDLKTGERQNPWNHFHNSYTSESVIEQVGIVKQEKLNFILIKFVVPALLVLFTIIAILFHFRKNKIIKLLSLGILTFSILLGAGMWLVPKITSSPAHTGPVEPLRVGVIAEYSTLIRVAAQQGFFKNNGLDITLTEYTSGSPAFKGLLSDEVDITSAADFVGVRNSFETQDFMILASMFESQNVFKLIARKDHSINEPLDLKGKKIGVTKKTGSEFFLGKFLDWNNILLNDVVLIDGQPSELATMLVNGNVDAVATFQPHAYELAQELGTSADTYEMQNNKNVYGLIYSRRSFIKERPDTIRRFVQSLVDAEKFVRDYPVEMQDFFSSEFQYSTDYIATVIPKVHFVISLNQSLLIGMEDQAQWVMANNLTDKTVIPNFIDFIYTDALRKIKLDAVTIY